jgi:hypothetical protein
VLGRVYFEFPGFLQQMFEPRGWLDMEPIEDGRLITKWKLLRGDFRVNDQRERSR